MLYEHKERGVDQGSELFQVTPSKLAKSVLFYLHRCGHFICNRDYKVCRKNFNSYLLLLVEEGSMEIENVGKVYSAKKGDVALINCHLPHTYSALENATSFSFLHFDGSNSESFYEHILERHQAAFSLHPDSVIPEKIHKLLELLRQNEATGRELMQENLLACSVHEILCCLLFADSEAGDSSHSSGNSLVSQAIQQIRTHYAEPMDIRGIADSLNVSQFHFIRLFKQEVGCPPHEYLTLFRIQRAKELLQGTDLSIAEIAGRVGYEYATSFTAAFQRRVGCSPKDFRHMLF